MCLKFHSHSLGKGLFSYRIIWSVETGAKIYLNDSENYVFFKTIQCLERCAGYSIKLTLTSTQLYNNKGTGTMELNRRDIVPPDRVLGSAVETA